ncbi:MAG: DEAD/DEAH box helicase [Candidatus Aenigmarchaeota archaeon]|nr:DEAD/DEAH box helicase [Candidatus Aenigmarchaeota archaeon]
MTFTLFSEKMQKLIRERGFLEPTLAQQMGMPEILKGTNVLIIAPTGIGKTEAAMLPLIDMVAKQESKPISVLYITPLRSLNRDLLDRLFWWADKMGIEIGVRHGDTSAAERTAQREAPPHILITTPETLQAVLTGKLIREHFRNVKYVVVDEIHELIESKRGTQLSVVLERLEELSKDFQRIGLSATVGSPQLVADFLGKNVKIIHADATKKYNIRVEAPVPGLKDKQMADDLVIGENTTARLRRLYELIKEHTSVLAFTNTRETAEVLSSRLRSLDRELKQAVHHGSLSKERRIRNEQSFKKQELKSLIATSSLELGIDIGSIDLVIQYMSPRQVSKLIQRVGRSGHGIGRTSKGIIISGDEDLFESAVIAKHAMEKRLEELTMHEKAYDVLANQIVGNVMENYSMPSDKIYEIIKRAYPYRDLKKKEFLEVLQFLETLHLVWLDKTKDGYEVKRRKKAFTYYFENLSTIPDKRQYKIVSVIENEPIGSLDEEFVAEHGQAGNKFVCAGRAWKIIQVYPDKVMVEPIEDIESAIPAWEGELIPVPFAVAQDVGRLRKMIISNEEKAKEFPMDSTSFKEMKKTIEKHAEKHQIPDDKTMLIENYKDFVIIHSCCGSLVNGTLGKYISAILTAETGVAVNIKSDPYRIMLQTVAKSQDVKRIIEEAANMENVLKASMERSSLFKWRFLQVARRFGIISRSVKYDKLNVNKIVTAYMNSPVYEATMNEVFMDKMDVENTENIIKKIKDGSIKMHIQEGLSYLGELGLVQQFSEVMKPRLPQKEIYLAFKKRLLTTRVRLLCVNCGEYNLVMTVRNVDQEPDCPHCGSRLIAVLRRGQINAQGIVRKKIKKKELTKEEQEEFQSVRRSADLVIVYGRKAVECLAGHGVGPQTAARILSMLQPNKELFYKSILEAEKQFARTKIYWK